MRQHKIFENTKDKYTIKNTETENYKTDSKRTLRNIHKKAVNRALTIIL